MPSTHHHERTQAEEEHAAASTVASNRDQFGVSFGPVGTAAISSALQSLGRIWFTDGGAASNKDECEILMVPNPNPNPNHDPNPTKDESEIFTVAFTM